ncbi:B- and T-lymphocyte attenuator-like [Archocentrus centrarchus]|uniref:B- and T-lymphocyte attenuator-like n=1 Tax=Archocentrus centrarchus TaxID=63155 RepID=UPI0011EA2246|nr:B- and T-lymphocyte attenuator-like [Archocentrus centrarchus]
MMGAFLRIMRPHRCWTIQHVSILAGLLLTLNADSAGSDCSLEIRVRRNTVYNASLGQELKIHCRVIFCNNSPPAVTWEKLGKTDVPVNVSRHIKTEWKPENESSGIYYLIFSKIQRSDSGQYLCRSGGSVGHIISVNVSEHGEIPTVTQNNAAASTTSVPRTPEDLLLYVYSAAGIATFVIIVIIISVISMRGCRGKPKKETQTENQYMEIPMVEQPFPQASFEPSQRGSPSMPPSRRSTKRQTPSRQPNELTLPRDNEQTYGQNRVGRERQRTTAEEDSSSVVYAALNHGLPQRAPRLRMEMEESSEYAAIRVA